MPETLPAHQLSFFPLPLPDELIDSVVYRYHLLSGNMHFRDTLEALYGWSRNYPSILMTTGLDDLFRHIPRGLYRDSTDLMNQLTLVPALATVFNRQQFDKVTNSSRTESGCSKSTLFRSPLKVVQEDFQCCPICVKEEASRIGTAYWHRSHQLDGAAVCHVHGCDLLNHCPHCGRPVRAKASMELPSPTCRECHKPLPTVFSYPDAVRELAVWAHEALSGKAMADNNNWLGMEVLRRTDGNTDVMCREARKRYGKRYCAEGPNPYYSLQGDWLGNSIHPHVQYYGWGRWTLRPHCLAHMLIIGHSLFESWEDMAPPKAEVQVAA